MQNNSKKDKELEVVEKNRMLIDFGYSMKLVLSVDNASKLIALLAEAENYYSEDYNNPTIGQIKKENLDTKIIGAHEYRKMKVKHLLLQEEG